MLSGDRCQDSRSDVGEDLLLASQRILSQPVCREVCRGSPQRAPFGQQVLQVDALQQAGRADAEQATHDDAEVSGGGLHQVALADSFEFSQPRPPRAAGVADVGEAAFDQSAPQPLQAAAFAVTDLFAIVAEGLLVLPRWLLGRGVNSGRASAGNRIRATAEAEDVQDVRTATSVAAGEGSQCDVGILLRFRTVMRK